MSKTITKSRLKGSLLRKFHFQQVAGSKHEAVALVVGGRKVATTRFSRGLKSEALGPSLLSKIAQQIRLPPGSLGMLHGMVDCSVGEDEYLAELRDGGYLQ